MRCLLIIPAYRESKRLPAFLSDLIRQLDRSELDCDVLVVDDGSGEQEQYFLRELTSELRKESPRLLEPLYLKENRGKGHAIRAGWECADKHDWVGFVDADGAVPAREVCRLLQLAGDSCQRAGIFASRIRMLGRSIERSGLRHVSGRLFAFLVGVSITSDIYDSQCGLKLIPTEHYRSIAHRLEETGFCFDVELLAALLAVGVPVCEVPIDWTDIPGSKVYLFRDTLRMALGVYRIFRRKQLWTFSNANSSLRSEPSSIGTIKQSSNC